MVFESELVRLKLGCWVCVLCLSFLCPSLEAQDGWARNETGPAADAPSPYSPREFAAKEMVIARQTADIHSGPGAIHYRTDRMSIGRTVTVYREDPDGWLAIRPPIGSFSLVRADDVAATEEPGIGKVVRDEVKAWVGTRLQSPTRPLSQVKLHMGELVKIVGEQYIKTAGGSSEKWLRIAPPAGEFRWIRDSAVTPIFPSDVSSHEGETAALDQVIQATGSSNDDEMKSVSVNRLVNALSDSEAGLDEGSISRSGTSGSADQRREQTSDQPGGLKPLAAEQRLSANESNEEPSVETARRATDGWEAAPENADRVDDQSGLAGKPTSSAEADSEDAPALDPERAIRELEIALTRMMTLPIELWNPKPIRDALNEWRDLPADRTARSDFEKIAAKLDECEELQRKLVAMNAAEEEQQDRRQWIDRAIIGNRPIGVSQAEGQQTELASRTGAGANANPTEKTSDQKGMLFRNLFKEGEFDPSVFAGVGYLNRLYTERGQGPPAYVLQDETGRILKVVTPAPGVNLERYLEKEVALVGEAVRHPRFNRPLIIADRVVLPERHRR